MARVSKGDPALAGGAHRAVAAAPQELLPFAIQAAAELDTDDACHWLESAQEAISAHAMQPDADAAVYQRAVDLVGQAQECLAAGTSPTTLFDDSESKRTSQHDSTSAESPPNRRSEYVLVKPKVKWHIRLVLTVLSLAYMATIALISAGVAASNGLGNGWVGWLYVPVAIGLNLVVASYWGGVRVDLSAGTTWVGFPLVVLMDVAMGSLFNEVWPMPSYFPPPWLFWLLVGGVGVACLPFTYRIWFGRLQKPAPADTRSSPSMLRLPPGQ